MNKTSSILRFSRQFLLCFLLFCLTACSSAAQSSAILVPETATASPRVPATATSPATQLPVPVQQSLPKGLLKARYPVMDWVFNVTCDRAVTSYAKSPMNAALAYDSTAWLYPDDGHLVQGWQNCDSAALVQEARNQGLSALLTVGVDSSWSSDALAQYIDRAASQAQVPCNASATTFICTIVNWAVAGGYTGVIIDFESVNGQYPHIRQLFATFMQKLQVALHAQGLLCGIALIHKVSDVAGADPSYSGNSFEDWTLLSGTDFLVDMVLDQDLSLGKPGPLVSIPWADQNVQYVWHTVPQALSKTIFEFPLYGREWQRDTQGTWHPLNDKTCQQASQLQATEPVLPDIATTSTTPALAWNDQNGLRHEVWYETPASLIAIMTHLQETVRQLLNEPQYALPTSFWYRGAECPGFFGPGNALEAFYHSS